MLYVAHHLSQILLFLDLFSSYYFVMLYCIFKAFPKRSEYAPGFVNYKKGSLDSQPQVKKFSSCLPMVGGSLRVLRLLPPLKLVAMV